MTPGAPMYVVGSPVFDEAVLHTAGSALTIAAPGASSIGKYVQAASLGTGDLDRPWFTEAEILDAGTMTLEMGPVPNLIWGAAAATAPPSLSTHDLGPFGCRS